MDQDISRRGGSAYDLPDDMAPPPMPEFGQAVHSVPELTKRVAERDPAPSGATAPHVFSPGAATGAAANGNGAKPKEPASLFWQQPIAAEEEVNWFVPPLPRREEQGEQVVGLLNELTGNMPHMPMRSWLAKWNYHTRSAAAAAEQVDVEREAERRFDEQVARGEVDGKRLDETIQSLEAREQAVQSELTEAQKGFAEAAARAGLACIPYPDRQDGSAQGGLAGLDKRLLSAPPAKGKPAEPATPDPHSDLHYAPSGIGPQSVEEALQLEKPDLDMVAGQQGVSPIPRHSLWNTILTFFMQFLAPLVCGFMLALCLGTLVGILDLDDFSRRDSAPKFILAAALGFVIVYLMGELFSNTVHALTRALEMKAELDDDRQIAQDPMLMDRSFVGRIKEFGNFRRPATPRLRAGLGITLILILAALGLGCAEVIAEGSGIRELHHQQIARRMRFRNPNSGLPPEEELWWPMYMVIGTLISGPYLMYKASKSWGESDVQLREAWLLHQQQTWIDSRRASPETGLAFQAATRVEHLENTLYDIKVQLKTLRDRRAALYNPQPDQATQSRRKEARAAAVGEALRLQTMIEEMVNVTEPLPVTQALPVRQSGGPPTQTARIINTRR